MEPRKYNIKAKLPKAESLRVNEKDKDVIKMKISQLPVVSNDATTGHTSKDAESTSCSCTIGATFLPTGHTSCCRA